MSLSLSLSLQRSTAVHFIRRIYYIIYVYLLCAPAIRSTAPSPRRLETLTTFQRRRLIIRKLGSPPPPVRPLVLYCPELNSHMTDGCWCGCSASSTARKRPREEGTRVEYKKYIEEVAAAAVGWGESRSEKEKKIKSQT